MNAPVKDEVGVHQKYAVVCGLLVYRAYTAVAHAVRGF